MMRFPSFTSLVFAPMVRRVYAAAMLLLFTALTLLPAMLAPTANAQLMAGNIDRNVTGAKEADVVATSSSSGQLQLGLKHLGDKEGYTLKTVRSFRNYSFTKPKAWDIKSSSHVMVTFQHSPGLLPERSSLNVSVNNRIVKTIRLDASNIEPTTFKVPIPTDILKDYNTLTFDVNQHYTYKCEDPFSAELWTTLLPETKLALDYQLKKSTPNFTLYPYPFLDDLAYGALNVAYDVPTNASAATLRAAATVATSLGQAASWRSMDAHLASGGLNQNNNLVVVGTPTENADVTSLPLQVQWSGSQFTLPNGQAVAPEDGVLQLLPHPSHADKTVLVVTGATPEAVLKAAQMVSRKPHHQLLTGNYVVVKQLPGQNPSQYRNWPGFIAATGETSLQQLGLETLTSRGFTAQPIIHKVKRMPDVLVAGKDTIKLHLVYSYSSQLSSEQSKLEVKLNGNSLKSLPLSNRNGENMVETVVEIPAGELFTYNDLEFQYYLFPDKVDLCKFVTDVHVWGTVHNTSYFEVPGQLKAALPDVGLINDGAFPFALHPDFRDVTLVLPNNPIDADVNLMLAIANRFGRVSDSQHGILLDVATADTLTDAQKKNHLVVVGSGQRQPLLDELDTKTKRLVQNGNLTPADDEQAAPDIANVMYASHQGVMEELINPWNTDKVILTLYGVTDNGLLQTTALLNDDKAFGKMTPGNIAVINDDLSISSGILVKDGQAKFMEPGEAKLVKSTDLPMWAWIAIGILAFMGLISFIRFLFVR